MPFIRWSSDLPLLGKQLYGVLSSIAHATGAALLWRTGVQFFLLDGAGGAGSGGGASGVFGVADSDQPLLFQVGACERRRTSGSQRAGPPATVARVRALPCGSCNGHRCFTHSNAMDPAIPWSPFNSRVSHTPPPFLEPSPPQMTQDVPDKGLYFFSALAAFKSRTCYAK